MEEQTEKKRRGRPRGSKDKNPSGRRSEAKKGNNYAFKAHNPDLPEGYNTKIIDFLMEITPETEVEYDDVPEMQRRFTHYLEMCRKYDQKVSNLQAYLAIGTTKERVESYLVRRSTNPERAKFFDYVKQVCGAYREVLANDGQISVPIAIFYGKNYDGLKDQQEHVVIAPNPLGETANAEELKQKYLESANLGDAKEIETTIGDEILLQIPETEMEDIT